MLLLLIIHRYFFGDTDQITIFLIVIVRCSSYTLFSATSATPSLGRRAYCPQINARGLHWNWTLAGTYAVQPCPGGATGLARWK